MSMRITACLRKDVRARRILAPAASPTQRYVKMRETCRKTREGMGNDRAAIYLFCNDL